MEKPKVKLPPNLLQGILVVSLIACAYLIGNLSAKVQFLSSGIAVPSAGAPAAGAAAPTEPAGPVPDITAEDHSRGDKNAQVILLEYSDLECPFCKSFHPTAKKAIEEFSGKVRWVYRHYPLSFHANAQKEAEASECVTELGGEDAFWKYIDAIYDRTTANGTGFALDKLGPLAAEVGVNQASFQTCLDSGKYADKIKKEEDGGSGAGITGTPGNILLNVKTGKRIDVPGAVPYDQLKTSIEEILKG